MMQHGFKVQRLDNNFLTWFEGCDMDSVVWAWPQAISQPKPSLDKGFLAALAWLTLFRSQSQAAKLRLYIIKTLNLTIQYTTISSIIVIAVISLSS